MRKRQHTKLIQEGQYVAEVDIELIDSDEGLHAIDPVLSGILGSASTVSWAYRISNATIGATNPEYQGEGILTSYEVSGTVGDAVTFSAEIQCSGAITRATS